MLSRPLAILVVMVVLTITSVDAAELQPVVVSVEYPKTVNAPTGSRRITDRGLADETASFTTKGLIRIGFDFDGNHPSFDARSLTLASSDGAAKIIDFTLYALVGSDGWSMLRGTVPATKRGVSLGPWAATFQYDGKVDHLEFVILGENVGPLRSLPVVNPEAIRVHLHRKPSRQNVVVLQRMLLLAGHLNSQPDGSLGPQSRAALRKWLSENGLDQTEVASGWL